MSGFETRDDARGARHLCQMWFWTAGDRSEAEWIERDCQDAQLTRCILRNRERGHRLADNQPPSWMGDSWKPGDEWKPDTSP